MNLLALNEIFKKKQNLSNPMDSSDQKGLQRQLDQLTDWVYILDSVQERVESEQRNLINNLDIEPSEVEKYSMQEIEDILQITSAMPQNTHAKRCYAKGLLCQGLKLQVKQANSDSDLEKNQQALECFLSALERDNGLNVARKLIADLHFRQQNFQLAANFYHEINHFMQAELCYKMLC